MTRATPTPTLSFHSTLESISDELEYYAFSVPEKTSRELGTCGAVPVSARVNGSKPFLVSLHPVGGGRHKMRVKAAVRKEARLKEGDRAEIQITVIDREAVKIPDALIRILKSEGVFDAFKAITPGKRNYALRLIDEAAKPETRTKRMWDAVEMARGQAGSDKL